MPYSSYWSGMRSVSQSSWLTDTRSNSTSISYKISNTHEIPYEISNSTSISYKISNTHEI